jgi:hypothetical protein
MAVRGEGETTVNYGPHLDPDPDDYWVLLLALFLLLGFYII